MFFNFRGSNCLNCRLLLIRQSIVNMTQLDEILEIRSSNYLQSYNRKTYGQNDLQMERME